MSQFCIASILQCDIPHADCLLSRRSFGKRACRRSTKHVLVSCFRLLQVQVPDTSLHFAFSVSISMLLFQLEVI